ncbi:MAG: glycosyltransferase family 4 protein [Methylophilaceae bacterium]
MRILIVSDNFSMKMGGEASLPFYYFKLFRARGIEVHCICHERVKDEIIESFSADDVARFTFIKDTKWQIAVYKFSLKFPPRISFIIGQSISFSTFYRARKITKETIAQKNIDVVLEPSQITPKGLSFMYDLGAPVVIGPLCGGLVFPPAFEDMDSLTTRVVFKVTRVFSEILHRFIPGKLQAEALVVANQRTEDALPKGIKGKVLHVAESGVDLDIWKPRQQPKRKASDYIHYVYAGRFVDWKGVEFLVSAFVKMAKNKPVILNLIGGGELQENIEAQVKKAGIENQVRFHGWITREESSAIIRECDVFVMPSLRECGGTAILEAMAIGLPAIVTNWCGPAQYVTPECGILVNPDSREGFVDGFAKAMSTLADSADLREKMGNSGQARVKTEYFDWDSKADRMIEIFDEVIKK